MSNVVKPSVFVYIVQFNQWCESDKSWCNVNLTVVAGSPQGAKILAASHVVKMNWTGVIGEAIIASTK